MEEVPGVETIKVCAYSGWLLIMDYSVLHVLLLQILIEAEEENFHWRRGTYITTTLPITVSSIMVLYTPLGSIQETEDNRNGRSWGIIVLSNI